MYEAAYWAPDVFCVMVPGAAEVKTGVLVTLYAHDWLELPLESVAVAVRVPEAVVYRGNVRV